MEVDNSFFAAFGATFDLEVGGVAVFDGVDVAGFELDEVSAVPCAKAFRLASLFFLFLQQVG